MRYILASLVLGMVPAQADEIKVPEYSIIVPQVWLPPPPPPQTNIIIQLDNGIDQTFRFDSITEQQIQIQEDPHDFFGN